MIIQRAVRTSGLSMCLAVALAGCSGGSDDPPATGTLTLGLIDGPVEDAQAVVIQFTGIELKPSGGPPLAPIPVTEAACDDFNAATNSCSIDLLDLTGTARRVVFSRDLPAGQYQWVRLLVNAEQNVMDSYIHTTDGRMCSLWIPSGSETGLKIVSGITVTANGESDYTLDFDVRKSITNPPGLTDPVLECAENFIMKPAIRIVDSTEVGAIAGTVDESLLSANCEIDAQLGLYDHVAVYVFEDPTGTAVADDLDGNGDPVTSASVEWDATQQAYRYEVGFLLAPETYRLALTCTADVDDAATDDFDPNLQNPQAFGFLAEQSVDVGVGATADGAF